MTKIKRISFGLILIISSLCVAQTAVLMPLPRYFAIDKNGHPLAGGKVFSYAAGTNTPLTTYTNSSGSVPNSDPVILDSSGGADIWLATGQAYQICTQTSLGVQIGCVDNVTGLATQPGSSFANSQIVPFSATPTFTALASNQLFQITLTGDVTSSSLPMTGISIPATVTFQIVQDAAGHHQFAWPPNVVGEKPIDVGFMPNAVLNQTFVWNGTTATASGPAYYVDAANNISVFSVETRAAHDATSAPASTLYVQQANNIPINALVPGSNGQCATITAGVPVWGSCAGIASVSSVFGRTGVVAANSGDYTVAQVTGAAPLASPALTGSPTAPTQSQTDNSTKIATTAFVKLQGLVYDLAWAHTDTGSVASPADAPTTRTLLQTDLIANAEFVIESDTAVTDVGAGSPTLTDTMTIGGQNTCTRSCVGSLCNNATVALWIKARIKIITTGAGGTAKVQCMTSDSGGSGDGNVTVASNKTDATIPFNTTGNVLVGWTCTDSLNNLHCHYYDSTILQLH